MNLNTSRWIITLIYALLFIIGLLLYFQLPLENPLIKLLAIDIVLTVLVAIVGLLVKNDSMYDLYWSVIPFLMLIYWIDISHVQLFNTRVFILIIFVTWWSWRLSYNWFRGWKGLKHEDWRYVDLRKKTGGFYPIVSFLGIQLFPTLIVFAASMPMQPIFYTEATLHFTDILGGLLMLTGIILEIFADIQMHDFRSNSENQGKIIGVGLWKYSRHPNYLGEIAFWWGLYVLSLATNPPLYLIAGPIVITLLFVGISIPLMEKRMQQRTGFAEYKKQTPVLIPWKVFSKRK
jgi:steroid 5-alpha reductase family enzyme